MRTKEEILKPFIDGNYVHKNEAILAMKEYAECVIEECALKATILETTAFSESRDIVCKSHESIVTHASGIVKTLRVDKGSILNIKHRI